MSDRKIAKNRFHKGVSSFVRITLRSVGLSLDEEMAQFALGGVNPFSGPPRDYVDEVVIEALTNRHEIMKGWEEKHPGRNPYPPSFPERVLVLVRDAQRACFVEESPVMQLEQLMTMCEKELSTDPDTIETPTEEDA